MCRGHLVTRTDTNFSQRTVALMLNKHQFGKIQPLKPSNPTNSKTPKNPGSGRGSSASYKFLPIPKSQEERDLMEAKARALNAKTSKNLIIK